MSKTAKVTSVAIVEQFRGYILKASCISQIHILFDMYWENSVSALVCQKRGNTTMGHKMLLHADMKVLKEKRKLLSRGKTKDNLVAYYTDTDKSQLYRNIQSSSVVD